MCVFQVLDFCCCGPKPFAMPYWCMVIWSVLLFYFVLVGNGIRGVYVRQHVMY